MNPYFLLQKENFADKIGISFIYLFAKVEAADNSLYFD